jgi:adenylate cyclase class 2
VYLDILPFGHFAEIEAPAEAIAGLAVRLGLSPADALSASYHQLNRQWRRSSGLPPSDDFVFDTAERQRLNAALGCDARPQGESC